MTTLYHNFVFVISFHITINTIHIPPKISFSNIILFNTFLPLPLLVSISVNRFNFAIAFFKAACHANPGAESKCARSNSYILTYNF